MENVAEMRSLFDLLVSLDERISAPPATMAQPYPWEGEPDKVKGYHAGLAYLIIRHPYAKHLCGYVKLPKGHPWLARANAKEYRRDYNGKYRAIPRGYFASCLRSVRVHGRITWFGRIQRAGLCPRGVWIGFDCSHWRDAAPMLHPLWQGTYRDINYVREQCYALAEAVAAAR